MSREWARIEKGMRRSEKRPYHERSYPLRSSIHRASHYQYHESSKRRIVMHGKIRNRRVWPGIVARWLEASKPGMWSTRMNGWANEEENEENEEARVKGQSKI